RRHQRPGGADHVRHVADGLSGVMGMRESGSGNTGAGQAVDLHGLDFGSGAHLLVKHALAGVDVGAAVVVRGEAPGWQAQLAAWCRSQGRAMELDGGDPGAVRVGKGSAQAGRWRDAMPTGRSDPAADDAIAPQAHPRWWRPARRKSISACPSATLTRQIARYAAID